jgi:hypothetical protein
LNLVNAGNYKYVFFLNCLIVFRSLVAGTKAFSQSFVLDAPISIVIVSDLGKFGDPNDAGVITNGILDVGVN